MHKEYILLNGFRKAKKDFTAGFHVPLKILIISNKYINTRAAGSTIKDIDHIEYINMRAAGSM